MSLWNFCLSKYLSTPLKVSLFNLLSSKPRVLAKVKGPIMGQFILIKTYSQWRNSAGKERFITVNSLMRGLFGPVFVVSLLKSDVNQTKIKQLDLTNLSMIPQTDNLGTKMAIILRWHTRTLFSCLNTLALSKLWQSVTELGF